MNNQQNNKNDKNDKDNKKRNAKYLAIFLVVSIIGTIFFNSIITKWRNGTETTISYNKFVTMVDKDQVKSVKVTDTQLKVTPKKEGNPFYKTTYTVQRISGDYELVRYFHGDTTDVESLSNDELRNKVRELKNVELSENKDWNDDLKISCGICASTEDSQ